MSGEGLDLERILAGLDEPIAEGHRSGMVALCGRPNVGKSTLVNRIVGSKVAIVTDVPGTTRNAIRGVLTRDDAQVVLLDTPGLAKPSTLLSRRLNELVRDTWSGVDAILFLVDVADGIGTGDEYLASELAGVGTPVIAVANKIDRVADKSRLLPALTRLQGMFDADRDVDVVPVSAETGENVDRLVEVIVSRLSEGPRLFPSGEVTDQPERRLAAEILREKLISRGRDELPHSIAVTVDEVVPDEKRDDLMRIEAVIHVERDSQKAIVIGKGGANLRDAATEARREMEVLFGSKVFLSTHVTVAPKWQRDPKQLGRLGY